MKPLKFLIGLLLIPSCLATTRAFASLLWDLRVPGVDSVPLGVWWLLGGALFWVILFMGMPRPVRTYVLAHELTHALWGVLMGARVSNLRVSRAGGSVTLSKTNFLITLAPYFFPFYTFLVLITYGGLRLFVDMSTYEPLWLALVGLSWAFHVTFTVTTLMQHQPDIAEHGRVFSYAVIYSLNLLGIGLWVVAVARPTLAHFGELLAAEHVALYAACWAWVQEGIRMLTDGQKRPFVQ